MYSINSRYPKLILLAGLLFSRLLFADSAADFSQANQLLFFKNHLQTIQSPTTLRYRFEKKGSSEEGFTDEIQVQIQELHENGEKKVAMKYFTGDREHYVPTIDGVTGNPLITLFLQRDVLEMSRLTGGSWRHFQKQMKLALENSAQISTVTIESNGKKLPARNILIQPYQGDDLLQSHKEFLDKYYLITLADEVPGEIYRIIASTPSASSSDTPLIEESVTFSETGS